jgi:PEP-CTERM motif
MKKLLLASAIVASVIAVGPVMAATITFDSVPSVGNPILTTPLITDGFSFSSAHYHTIDSPGLCTFGGCIPGNGSIYLGADAPALAFPITMTRVGGGTFDLVSADLAQLFNDGAASAAGGFPNADHISMTGSNGNVVTLNPASLTLMTLLAGGLLNGVTSVVFEGFGPAGEANWSFALDNIVVDGSAVPLPAALPLFASGLGMLGLLGWRRKRKSAAAVAAA